MLDYNIMHQKLASSLCWFNTSTFMISNIRKCMKAKFNSSCTSCGEQIKSGKEITKDQTGRWVHKHCAPEIIDLP